MAMMAMANIFEGLENVDLSLLGGPRLPEVGKIKIGKKGRAVKTRSGKEMRLPEKIDHFILTGCIRDEVTGDFVVDMPLMKKIAEMTSQQPDKLRFLPVRLLFDDPDLNFTVRYLCYQGVTPWCIGDGKKAYRLQKDGSRVEVKCPCERCNPLYQGPDKCKVFGRLSVLLEGANRLGGVWVFRTTSVNSVRNILTGQLFLKQLTGGVLAGLPLILGLQPRTVLTPQGQQTTIYVATLEFSGSAEDLHRLALSVQKERLEYKVNVEMLEDRIRKELSALPVEYDETPQEVAEEFYPEAVAEADAEVESEEVVETKAETKTAEETKETKIEAKTEVKSEPTVIPSKDQREQISLW